MAWQKNVQKNFEICFEIGAVNVTFQIKIKTKQKNNRKYKINVWSCVSRKQSKSERKIILSLRDVCWW